MFFQMQIHVKVLKYFKFNREIEHVNAFFAFLYPKPDFIPF